MGTSDNSGHTAEDLRGKAKEAAGSITGDEALERQGKTDQAKASAKDAVDKAKDAAGSVRDAVTD